MKMNQQPHSTYYTHTYKHMLAYTLKYLQQNMLTHCKMEATNKKGWPNINPFLLGNPIS